MRENLTNVSERLKEKATRIEETKLVSSPSYGAKNMCSDEGNGACGDGLPFKQKSPSLSGL